MERDNNLKKFILSWRNSLVYEEVVKHWIIEDERKDLSYPFPDDISNLIKPTMVASGIQKLYSHQIMSWEAIKAKQNIVIVTGTASGKSLCYTLPIMEQMINNPRASALLIFPTKALAQDQAMKLKYFIDSFDDRIGRISVNLFDGDTPSHIRSTIRKQPNILITNPDMLHLGILPHHTLWVELFTNLQYIVIDEIHTYRGIFGSHITNLIRRLKRVARHYGSKLQFILTSATIGNPQSLASYLIEEEVYLVAEDGAPKGERHFAFYNPPIINRELGTRRGLFYEVTELGSELLARDIQTLIFTRTRRGVEFLLRSLREANPSRTDEIQGYRSGYLPAERREIEAALRSKKAKLVVTTNALELGVDIGNVDAVILAGYPGTIASTRQQAGRAGRRGDISLAMFIASMSPIDQYLMQHPEFLLDKSPEYALIDPNNLLILLQHLECAAFELPLKDNDRFGNLPASELKDLLDFLVQKNSLHHSSNCYYWKRADYPSSQVSLRTSSSQRVGLRSDQNGTITTIGEVDGASACWMVHPQAIYLHRGETYLVERLDMDNNVAWLQPVTSDYYTQSLQDVSIEKIDIRKEELIQGAKITFGDIKVTSQVVGFRKKRWLTHEVMEEQPLDLPPAHLSTTAFWLSLDQKTTDQLKVMGLWTNDRNEYGSGWSDLRERVRERDRYTCQLCGLVEAGKAHHVHHKTPFRLFTSVEAANSLDNLITLCPTCHQQVEAAVRIRSGLAGLSYVLHHLASLFAMCDIEDLGVHSNPRSPLADGAPTIVIYDQIPAGIGLSQRIYQVHKDILKAARELVENCECLEGCPACVGPSGESGGGGRKETRAILTLLIGGEI